MSQISPPIRIVLVLAVAVMGLYMLFLRPKDEVVPPPTAVSSEAVSQPGKVGEAAQGAVEAANGQLAQQESVDGVDAGEAAATEATASAPAKGTGARAGTSADLQGLPKSVARPLRDGRFLVLLFWNGRSADDREVRAAVRDADRWKGRVHVEVAPIKAISRYGRIARGVSVEQSPTIVIADPQLRAETLVGYVDRATIDQAVVDAMRNSTGLFTDAYLRRINSICARYDDALLAIPTPDTAAQVGPFLQAGHGKWQRFANDFRAVEAPRRWAAFRKANVADMTAWLALYGQWSSYLGKSPTPARTASSLQTFGPRVKRIDRRFSKRMDGQRVVACGADSAF